MPIYSYKCDSCGHQSDVLQKISDSPLKDCPACSEGSYRKQLTAAGFVLKGGGWYVTDFKNQNKEGQDGKKTKKTADNGISKDDHQSEKLGKTKSTDDAGSAPTSKNNVKETKATPANERNKSQ